MTRFTKLIPFLLVFVDSFLLSNAVNHFKRSNSDTNLEQMKSFTVILRNKNGEILYLTYELENHSVSDRFAYNMQKILMKKHKAKYTAWGVYPAGEYIIRKLIDELCESIDYFNKNNGAGLNFTVIVPEASNITNRDLNLIHKEFERLITQTFEVPTGAHNKMRNRIILNGNNEKLTLLEDSLNSVNGLVHSLEHVVARGPNSYASFFSTYLSSIPRVPDIPLRPDDYKLFRLDYSFGDLLLG